MDQKRARHCPTEALEGCWRKVLVESFPNDASKELKVIRRADLALHFALNIHPQGRYFRRIFIHFLRFLFNDILRFEIFGIRNGTNGFKEDVVVIAHAFVLVAHVNGTISFCRYSSVA